MNVALYTRMSRNGTQDAGNQTDELRAWTQRPTSS
jgi:DNA invertase Pin-like site-specific DNA recombinase